MTRLVLFLAVHVLAPAGSAAQAGPPDSLRAGPLTLVEAIRAGRARAVSAQSARASLALVEARRGQRRADLLPALAGSLGATRQTLNLDEFGFPGASGVTPAFSLFRARLSAQQALLDPAALARVRAIRDTSAAAELDVRSAGELAGAAAGLAWLRVVAADETVRAREADSVVAADLVRQSRELVAAGVSPAIDATRSETSLAAVLAQLDVARNQAIRTRLDLRRALDLDATAPLALADAADGLPLDLPASADDAEQFALAHRSELAAERARLAAATRALGAIRAERLPSLVASGFVQESGRRVGGLAGTWSIGVGLAVPIIDGFRREARVAEQRTRIELQQLREHDAARQIATEVRQAVADLASADVQVSLAEARLRLAEQELAQAQERFTAGVAGSLETTTAQGSLLAARDARIQARIARGIARVMLARALGVIDQLP
jgi:outer membrane protein TolC